MLLGNSGFAQLTYWIKHLFALQSSTVFGILLVQHFLLFYYFLYNITFCFCFSLFFEVFFVVARVCLHTLSLYLFLLLIFFVVFFRSVHYKVFTPTKVHIFAFKLRSPSARTATYIYTVHPCKRRKKNSVFLSLVAGYLACIYTMI